MHEIIIGEVIIGYSSSLRSDFSEFNLYLGAGNTHRDDRKIASFELLGFRVKVCDQPMVGKISELRRKSDRVGMKNYLTSLLMEQLTLDPSHMKQRIEDAHEEGVQEGRQQKIKEFKQFFAE